MHAEMFASFAKMTNLKEYFEFLVALVRNDFSNMISLDLLLSRCGSGTNKEGAE